jgi:hypothetical protein
MRIPVRLGLVVATAATLAACGSIAAPTAAPPHSAHSAEPRLARSRPGPPAGRPASAAALAARLLSRLRLPAGAHRLPSAPVPRPLREPDMSWGRAANLMDAYRLFSLPQPMAAVAADLAAARPAGMRLSGTGESGGTARPLDGVSYTPRALPVGIYEAQLTVTVAPSATGGSLVRADAQVFWVPARTAAEYIDPARYHALQISVTVYNPKLRTIRRVVTSQAAIRRLADALNRSPALSVKTLGCPIVFAVYRLAFAAGPHSRPDVVVSATRWPCEGAGISVAGHAQPALTNAEVVVSTADRLLGFTPRL